ncbi:MAG TPA: tol-pal system protein YbgF [Rhodanobacteraceae bacterium]
MKLPVAIQPWASRSAAAAICAAVALWVPGSAFAQVTPARQDTAAPAPVSASPTQSAGNVNQATALVNQIEMLKQQNRQLLGQVEQLQHQFEQLKEIDKEQYLALDSRIKKLEQAAAAAPTAGNGQRQAAGTKAGKPFKHGSEVAGGRSNPASASTAAGGDAGAQTAYYAAFNALRAGDFVTSSRGFRAFTQQYPHDKLTPNAWYWLGESYYVTQNYAQALQAFDQVIQRFPDSGKAPGALLKKGYCQYALKQTTTAVATLQAVMAKYPDSSEAQLAKQRLADIRLQQQLH